MGLVWCKGRGEIGNPVQAYLAQLERVRLSRLSGLRRLNEEWGWEKGGGELQGQGQVQGVGQGQGQEGGGELQGRGQVQREGQGQEGGDEQRPIWPSWSGACLGYLVYLRCTASCISPRRLWTFKVLSRSRKLSKENRKSLVGTPICLLVYIYNVNCKEVSYQEKV